MALGAGKLIRRATKPSNKRTLKEGKHVAKLMTDNYGIGDFLIVDSKRGKHVGFFAGVIWEPFPSILLASIWRYFGEDRVLPKAFDGIQLIETREIFNVKAAQVDSK